MVVVLELRNRQEVIPVVLSFVDEYAEELVELLVDAFCLSVHLGVPSCGEE